jgi:hypothetical protein
MKKYIDLFLLLPVQAKVAFFEWAGREELFVLDGEALDFAKKGLDLICRWRKDEDVARDELHQVLMNNQDEGLFAFLDSRHLRPIDLSIEIIGSAISYTAWEAYKKEGSGFPQGYDQMDEEFLQWAFDNFACSSTFRNEKVLRALMYFSARSESDEFIELIDLENKI